MFVDLLPLTRSFARYRSAASESITPVWDGTHYSFTGLVPLGEVSSNCMVIFSSFRVTAPFDDQALTDALAGPVADLRVRPVTALRVDNAQPIAAADVASVYAVNTQIPYRSSLVLTAQQKGTESRNLLYAEVFAKLLPSPLFPVVPLSLRISFDVQELRQRKWIDRLIQTGWGKPMLPKDLEP